MLSEHDNNKLAFNAIIAFHLNTEIVHNDSVYAFDLNGNKV